MKSQINQKIIISLAKPEDKYEIIKIQYNALKVLSAKDYSSKQLSALLKSKSIARKSAETIFIAEINSQVIGFASLLHPPNTIGAVFVNPNFTRKNVGTSLLKRLEQEATENNIAILKSMRYISSVLEKSAKPFPLYLYPLTKHNQGVSRK